jgi:hypothetical protein
MIVGHQQVEGTRLLSQQGQTYMVKITGAVQSHHGLPIRRMTQETVQRTLEAPESAKGTAQANPRPPFSGPVNHRLVGSEKTALERNAAVQIDDPNLHGLILRIPEQRFNCDPDGERLVLGQASFGGFRRTDFQSVRFFSDGLEIRPTRQSKLDGPLAGCLSDQAPDK